MAAYRLLRVSFKGVLVAAQARFSFGLSITPPGDFGDDAAVAAILAQIRTVLNTGGVGTNLMAAANADSQMTSLKGSYYPAGSTSALHVAEVVVGPFSGTGTTELPAQCALVASLLTGRSGRHNRGRIYLPADGLVLSSGQVADGKTTSMANAVATLIGQINVISGLGAVVIASTGTSTAPAVTGVKVDSIVDTQRRRAQSQTALYSHTSTL